jgi:hypothetical protein
MFAMGTLAMGTLQPNHHHTLAFNSFSVSSLLWANRQTRSLYNARISGKETFAVTRPGAKTSGRPNASHSLLTAVANEAQFFATQELGSITGEK